MERTRVAIYMNVARDGDSPAWLRVGFGVLRPDGSLLACLDHLPADGRVRLQVQPLPGEIGPETARPSTPVRTPRPPNAARRMPPPPAVRKPPARLQESTPW